MAANSFTIDLTGDRELVAFLNSFPAVVVKGALREASKKAFRPVLATARAKAARWESLSRQNRDEPWHSRWREIRKAITFRQKTYARDGRISSFIWVKSVEMSNRGRGKEPFNPGKIANLLEYGTAPHQVGNHQHPGAQPRPFMRPAFDENKVKATAVMVASLRPALEQAAAKEARRVAKKYGAGGRP